MDTNALIAAKLAEAGLTFFNDAAIEDLAKLYQGMLQWQSVLEAAVEFETDPAIIFRAAPGV